MFQNVLLFYSLKNVQDWLYVEHYLLQQTMHSMLLCVTHNNNSSFGNIHVIIFMWITACKFSWYFAVSCIISSTVMWTCCYV